MPKRKNLDSDKKYDEIKKLRKQLREMQNRLCEMQSSSSGSDGDIPEGSSDNDIIEEIRDQEPVIQELQDPLEPPEVCFLERTEENNTEQDFSALGSRPEVEDKEGDAYHEEIAVRWNSYLRKGITKEQRAEIIKQYKLPANCKSLVPPQVNEEIKPCLPKFVNENDFFLTALQQQLAHGLSAVGLVIQRMLPAQERSTEVKALADACQLFCNVHHAISAHRKYKIVPHLNPDCKKVAQVMPLDEFLFSKDFTEAVKNEQALKKKTFEFKKRSFSASSIPGPSGVTSRQHLNYQRFQYKGRYKEQKKEEKKATYRNRTKSIKEARSRPYRR